MANTTTGNLANLVATIDSVAAGESAHDQDDEDMEETEVVTAEMLEGTVLHLADGQAVNVVQMPASIEDTLNVVHVETAHLDDNVSSVEEICTMEIENEEQNHILSETGAHVVVKTEEPVMPLEVGGQLGNEKPPIVLPTIPFSFPGQTFDTKCQKLILNVWDFFRRVKKNPDLLDEIRTPQERAAAALHISAATIGKIGKNFKRTGKLETPGKKRKRTKPVVDSVSTEQEDIIRRIIKEFKDNSITPTLPLILNECRERINFQGGATSFRRILQRMGFKGLSAKTFTPSSSKSKSLVASALSGAGSISKSAHATLSATVKHNKKESNTLSLPSSTPVSPSPSKKFSFKSTEFPSNTIATLSPNKQITSENISKTSKVMANLFGGNIFQLGTSFKGETIPISQQTAAAIANAARAVDGPQTIHVLQPDNTVQQIQIVYASM